MNGALLRVRPDCLMYVPDCLIRRWRTRRTSWNGIERTALSLGEVFTDIAHKGTLILKESWQPLDRIKVEVEALGQGNLFGVQKISLAMRAKFETGDFQETSRLLPNSDQAAAFIWSIFVSKPLSVVTEPRAKVLLLSRTEGVPLIELRDPFDLCEAIAHSLIGGFGAFE